MDAKLAFVTKFLFWVFAVYFAIDLVSFVLSVFDKMAGGGPVDSILPMIPEALILDYCRKKRFNAFYNLQIAFNAVATILMAFMIFMMASGFGGSDIATPDIRELTGAGGAVGWSLLGGFGVFQAVLLVLSAYGKILLRREAAASPVPPPASGGSAPAA